MENRRDLFGLLFNHAKASKEKTFIWFCISEKGKVYLIREKCLSKTK